MVQDLSYNLCESLVENIDGVAGIGKKTPPPPVYLTQWKIVGNSEVHNLPYPDIPQGYTKCKYLEFYGTEWLDSGIIPEQGIAVDIQCTIEGAAGLNMSIIGCRSSAWSADSLYIFRHGATNKMFVSYGGKVIDNSAASPSISSALSTIKLSAQEYNYKTDTEDYTKNVESSIIKGNNSMLLGKVAGYADGNVLVGKVYYLKISLNNAILFNGIPCLDDNNVPCLYDTVSGTSFYNDGTGTFGYEIEPQPTEIWSCGEYSAVDNKYHILVQPLGGSVADIVLDEPLRKVNDVADTIEFPSEQEGKAIVTRNIASIILGESDIRKFKSTNDPTKTRWRVIENISKAVAATEIGNILSSKYPSKTANATYICQEGISLYTNGGNLHIYDENYSDIDTDVDTYKAAVADVEVIFELATSTTELVDVSPIEESTEYSMVISQGAKAVEWSSFETE